MNIIKTERRRIRLTGIQSQAWEHPADRLALRSLQSIPVLDTVIKAIYSQTLERSIRLAYLASSVKVTQRQFKNLDNLLAEACEVLDLPEKPELFIAHNPFLNAGAVGVDKPFIVLNSSLLEFSDEEIFSVIGHELGHIKSGHLLYRTLLLILVKMSQIISKIPVSGLALEALILALQEWGRKSELSADRAEALTVQNPDVVIHALMRLAGGRKTEEMNLAEFIAQADEYKNSNSVIDTTHKILNTLWLSHPFPVVRAVELLQWVRSGEYDFLLNGGYKEKKTSFKDDFKETTKNYKEDFKQTAQPFEEVLGKVKDNAEDLGKKAKDAFDKWAKKG